jgi:hypothetical protein
MINLKISALILAATTAFAAPAFASNGSLAASVGVDANAYTTNQLVPLKSALDSDDTIRANFIRSQAGVTQTDAIRVAPAFVIKHAEQNGDFAKATFLKDWNAGEIDAISADAAARQAQIFEAQQASEENRGS